MKLNLKNLNGKSGIITLINWTMCPDGNTYLYLYSNEWNIITDKEMPNENFRSTEHWQLIGKDGKGNIKILLPGCQVKAWVFCKSNPDDRTCYSIR